MKKIKKTTDKMEVINITYTVSTDTKYNRLFVEFNNRPSIILPTVGFDWWKPTFVKFIGFVRDNILEVCAEYSPNGWDQEFKTIVTTTI